MTVPPYNVRDAMQFYWMQAELHADHGFAPSLRNAPDRAEG